MKGNAYAMRAWLDLTQPMPRPRLTLDAVADLYFKKRLKEEAGKRTKDLLREFARVEHQINTLKAEWGPEGEKQRTFKFMNLCESEKGVKV